MSKQNKYNQSDTKGTFEYVATAPIQRSLDEYEKLGVAPTKKILKKLRARKKKRGAGYTKKVNR